MPKPLIKVKGEEMYTRATESLPLRMASKLIFVVLRSHVNEYCIDKMIQTRFGKLPIKIVVVDKVTSGQSETVSIALNGEDVSLPLLVFNADSAFEDNVEATLKVLDPDVDGAVQYFYDSDPRWSFIRLDSYRNVTETAEKNPISNCASSGLYYFRRAETFLNCEKMTYRTNGERYIAPLYNTLIQRGHRIVGIPVKKYYCFGTPRDLEEYLSGKCYTGEGGAEL